MGQFVGAVQGIKDACLALEYPVVSGNCSLYNETNGNPIMPAPVIGGVGILSDVSKAMTIGFKGEGESIFVVGESRGHIGQSLYLREIHGKEEGAPPPVDLAVEKKLGMFVRKLIAAGDISACHDVSDGGLLVAIAEMALAGNIGCALNISEDAAFWFGEDQGRYVVTVHNMNALEAAAEKAGVFLMKLGRTSGKTLSVQGGGEIEISSLRATHEQWLPEFMD
jgi:phosphoribosylformylglycinamidine synthase